MFQQDYILRMTQQLAALIAKLMGKNIHVALEMIDENYTEWLKVDAAYLDSIPEETFLETLIQEHKFHVNQFEFLAELLAKEGEFYFEAEEFLNAKNKFRKALIVFEHVNKEQSLFSMERMNLINTIKKYLQQIEEN